MAMVEVAELSNHELRSIMSAAEFKRLAAETAANLVQSNTIVGLGTGSTAVYAVRRIGERLASGELENVVGIATSRRTEAEAHQYGVPLTTFTEHPFIDMTIDGADEIDPQCNLIKGGGAALLREKIVAQASKKLIIVADESKLVKLLGETWALPVEVLVYGAESQRAFLERLGATVTVRKSADGHLFHTVQGNLIFDCQFGPIADPHQLARQLDPRAGIVEHGLFLGMAEQVIVAGVSGIQILRRSSH